MSQQHSTFKKLVAHDDDFIGMVAYTIYKNEKINWIDHYTQRNGNPPTFQEIQNSFNVTSDSDQKVQQYLNLAERKLNTFVDQTIAVELEQYKRDILNTFADPKIQDLIDNKLRQNLISGLAPVITKEIDRATEIAKRIEIKINPLEKTLDTFKPTFFQGLLQNIAATIVTSILVAVISIVFWLYNIYQNDQKKENLKQEMKKEYNISEEEWQKLVKASESK